MHFKTDSQEIEINNASVCILTIHSSRQSFDAIWQYVPIYCKLYLDRFILWVHILLCCILFLNNEFTRTAFLYIMSNSDIQIYDYAKQTRNLKYVP